MSIESKNTISQLKHNRFLVFSLVTLLAIQNLIFQITFKLNFPYSVDFTDIFTPMFDFIVNGEFTFFINKGIHVMFFPKLISLPNLYFNSFDVVNLTYVYWIVMSLSIFFIYLIIKQTDRRLIWTIIPISAFIYNPLTTSGYFMLVMLEWYFPLLGIVSIIYLLNKKTIKTKIFASSIGLAIFSTFSILLGVVSWIAGLTILLKSLTEKKLYNKKWILLWISSSTIIGFLYMQLTSGLSEPTRLDLLFSFTGFSFIANFLASSFRLKYDILMLVVGSFSILISFFYIWYFIKKDYLKQYFPWFVMLFTAFTGSIITALGRMQLEDHIGNEPYYSTISQLFQIGLILLTAKILLEYRLNSKTRKQKIIIVLLLTLIISQMILLVPSYYSGWQRGEYYFNEKSEFVTCFSLHPDKKCLEVGPMNHDLKTLSIINHLIKNEQSIFKDHQFTKVNPILKEKFSTFSLSKQNEMIGKISYINNTPITLDSSNYELTDEIIKIDGSINNSIYDNIEKIYLKIDDELLIEFTDFQIIDNSSNSRDTEWSLFFMSGYIPDGCNTLAIFTMYNNDITNLDSTTICK
tara:strand:- start:5291 stop:7021 length:1731 start_codon:yes stop_codon:yes gene_type:complete